MTLSTHRDLFDDRFDSLLAEATTDLVFALGSLRLLTILPICPEVALDSEERVNRALERIAEARRLHGEF